MRSLVVLPAYNEADNVLPLTKEILAQDPTLSVLVVDDNSPDGTGDLVAQEMEREPRPSLLRREGKLGLGSAYLSGFRHGLEQLAAMHDYDVVIGSRYVPGGGISNWAFHRRALSAFANFYTRALLRLPVRDCTSGYRCYSREVLERIEPFEMHASGYSFLEEMVYRVHRCGFRIGEVPIVFEDRLAGASKINQSEIFRAAWHVLATAVRPLRLPKRGPGQ
jgi:dolichol-phosphate mannosyltransferase